MPREHRASDVEVVRDQLGREPTTRFEVVVRCPIGHPLVIRDDPLDVRGEPFPTTFWLTCPDAVKAVSRLEADGAIRRLNERFADDADFRTAVERAHAEAAEERARMLPAARRLGRRGRHASRDQVSARALREPSRRGRRRRRCLGLRAGGTDPPRAPDRGADRGGRPGDPFVPAARGRAGARRCAPRAGERHGDHEAWPGRRRHGCARPRGRRTQRTRPRAIRAPGAGAGGADRSRHRDQRRARRVEPRPVRGVGPRRMSTPTRGSSTGAEEARLSFLGGTLRAVGRRRPLPAAGYRRRLDGVRRRARARASGAAGQHPDGLGPADRTCDRHRSARSRRSGGGAAIDRRAAGRGRARRPRDPHRAHVRRRVGHRHDDAGDRARPRSIRPGRRSIGPGSRSPTPRGCSRTWRG